jgi:hypothetical protein
MNASKPFQNDSEDPYHFLSVDLDPYSEGDLEFKRELAASLKQNILELNHALKISLAVRQGDTYQKAHHKATTTLFVLGGKTLNSIAGNITDRMVKDQYASSELTAAVIAFEAILETLIKDLNEVIQSV